MLMRSDYYTKLGENVRKKLFPELQGAGIVYLESDRAKQKNGKAIYAECKKVSKQYEWCADGAKYMIVYYAPNISYMTEAQLEILTEHELMHVGYAEDFCKIIPHDFEEFAEIIRKYGAYWDAEYIQPEEQQEEA